MDVICLGELLIDLIGGEISDLVGVKTFKKFPGGAAGNVAVGISKQGLKAGFIGKVGRDPFGDFLVQSLEIYNVDTSQICKDEQRKTGLAFVSLDEKGVLNYLFYRDSSASMLLKPEEINEEYIKKGKSLYFSSMSLINEPFRSANSKAIEFASKFGLYIVFDPNIRISLWESKEEARREIKRVIAYVNILKINIDELFFLEGRGEKEDLCNILFRNYPNLKLLALTMGAEGSLLMNNKGNLVQVDTFNKVKVKDTTGAGDAFIGALLSNILKNGEFEEEDKLYQIGRYANAAATLITQKLGDIAAMPTKAEIESFLINS